MPKVNQHAPGRLTLYQTKKKMPLSKLKTFVDYKSDVSQIIKFVFHGVENTMGKRENADYQHLLLFPQCFQKAFPQGRQNPGCFCKGLNIPPPPSILCSG